LRTQNPSAKILVTGHSLGGALAVLAAADIKRSFPDLADNELDLYTFGCPRVGTPLFAEYIFKLFAVGHYYRITHANDLVPHLPNDIIGFRHGGNEVWYTHDYVNDDRSFRVCEYYPDREDPTCSNSNWIEDSIKNHLYYLHLQVAN
jgi:hypothetical protein